MQVKCTSCGASQNISQAQNCDFCRAPLPKIDTQSNWSNEKITKATLSGSYENVLSYVSRGIEDINQLINIHPDNEISEVDSLYLQRNRLRSINGINKFDLSTLNLSDNELSILDDFPTIREEVSFQSIDERFQLNIANNKSLTTFSDSVIKSLNSYKNITRFEINLIGCSDFDFSCLTKINFSNILGSRSIYGGSQFWIFVDPNVTLPIELKNQGFELKQDNDIQFHVSNEKNEAYQGVWWFLNKENQVALKDNISESKNEKPKSGCFIATAAMGDYDHPVVVDLRLFRDNWLRERKWGKNFITWYYEKGPKAAKVIEKSTLLRKITFFTIVKPLHLLTRNYR